MEDRRLRGSTAAQESQLKGDFFCESDCFYTVAGFENSSAHYYQQLVLYLGSISPVTAMKTVRRGLCVGLTSSTIVSIYEECNAVTLE